MSITSAHYLDACLQLARPRLNTMLKLMFGEARIFGHSALWLGSVINLMRPLGFQEKAVRTALFRLSEQRQLRLERHGRRSLCMLAPDATAQVATARQRLSTPPSRSFGEDWTMLINSGGIGAARYALARKQLRNLEYCQLAPNVMARPAACGRPAPGAMPASEDHGLALFEVSGSQLAAAVRQPLFGKADWDFAGAEALYRQFEQRFQPLRQILGRHGAFNDQQAYLTRLMVSHGYQHCRRSDPLLPQELLPDDWPAMTAYQTYLALYGGCALQARRHMLKLMTAAAPALPELSAA